MTNLAQVIMVNCFTSDYMDKDVCQRGPDVKDGFPRMVLLSPPKLKFNPYTGKENSYTEKKYTEREVTPKILYNFITDGITDYSVSLHNDNIDDFLNNVEMNKMILFTDKDKTPLLYRGLSGEFYDRIKFGIVKKDQKDILARFRINQFPTLLMYNVVDEGLILYEHSIDIYSGEITGPNLSNALTFNAIKEKKYITDKKSKDKEEPIKKEENKTEDEGIQKLLINTSNHFGIKLTDEMTFDYQFGRFKRPTILSFNSADKIHPNIVKLAEQTAGFINFYEFNCLRHNTTEYINVRMNYHCPNVGETEYYYYDPKKIFTREEYNITTIMSKAVKIENLNFAALQKFLTKKIHTNLIDIVSSDYKETLKQVYNDNMTPLIFLYDEVILFLLFIF
jgi:hypothetical protein